MTAEAYGALAETAERRLALEWDCPKAMRAILSLIVRLSYGERRSWACIPNLGDVVAVTGYHKSTVSRALRGAVKRRYLMTAKFGEENLYQVCTATRGAAAEGRGAEGVEDASRAAALARLVEIQRRRAGGEADADGQMRMPEFFASEEVETPAAAFEAMMEQVQGAPGSGSGPEREPVVSGGAVLTEAELDRMPEADYRVYLAGLAEQIRSVSRPPPPSVSRVATIEPEAVRVGPGSVARADVERLDAEFARMTHGLSAEATHALRVLREEVKHAGKVQEAQFLKGRVFWRETAAKHPLALAEAAGAHKGRRLESGFVAKQPAGWVWAVVREMLGNQAPSG